jgi:hypothetical protein
MRTIVLGPQTNESLDNPRGTSHSESEGPAMKVTRGMQRRTAKLARRSEIVNCRSLVAGIDIAKKERDSLRRPVAGQRPTERDLRLAGPLEDLAQLRRAPARHQARGRPPTAARLLTTSAGPWRAAAGRSERRRARSARRRQHRKPGSRSKCASTSRGRRVASAATAF